ncbi:MAG TPA: histidinol-phosphatase HisJ [Candidatus Atribacteria bacterium]|nr:histidinol-phosphatase HisJ [Candidatus Atribacteria bacterium]
MFLGDYHIHTPRCGDARGSYSDYVEEALRKGLSEIGFSGHCPQYFCPPEERKRESAIPEEELALYIQEVESLREKYRPSIVIRLGLEVDFVPGKEEELQSIVDFYSWDYLLLSIHYLDRWPFDDPRYLSGYKERDINEIYQSYYQTLIAGMKTGFFDAVAHFDLPKKFGFRPTKAIKEEAEALQVCREQDLVVELNTAGRRKPVGEFYPAPSILTQAQELGLKVCLGSDAHQPEEVGKDFKEALALLRYLGFDHIVGWEKRMAILYPIP